LVEPPVDFDPPREDPDADGALVLDEADWDDAPEPEPEPDPEPEPPLAVDDVAVAAVVLEVVEAVIDAGADVVVLALADAEDEE
jgi:hypothetical protein